MPVQLHVYMCRRKSIAKTSWQHGLQGVLSKNLSLCRHCHPANGTFNPRDTLAHAISPNVFTEVSKEVEESEITSQYRVSMARNLIVGAASHLWTGLQTKFQPHKLILGVLSDFS